MPYLDHVDGWQHAGLSLPDQMLDAIRGRFVAAPSGGLERIRADAITVNPPSDPVTRWIGVDGSSVAVPVDATSPSRTVGWARATAVAASIVDLDERDAAGLIPLGAIEDRTSATTIEVAVPLHGLHMAGTSTMVESWQAAIWQMASTTTIGSSTVAGWLDRLLVDRAGRPARLRRCPLWTVPTGDSHGDLHCTATNIDVTGTPTPCPGCGRQLYPTDRLDVLDTVSEDGANRDALNVLMAALERALWAITLVEAAESAPGLLADTLVVVDGPLAAFGRSPALRNMVHGAIGLAQTTLADARLAPLALVGVEKSGRLTDHLANNVDVLPAGTVTNLTDAYLASVLETDSISQNLGALAYLGRRVAHHTTDGRLHLLSVAPAEGWPYGAAGVPFPDAYPALQRVADGIERLACAMYPDALLPIVIAHDTCAYPASLIGTLVTA